MTIKEVFPLVNPRDERGNDHWREAFRLFHLENPGYESYTVSCSSCREAVYKWLKRKVND